MSTYQGTKQVTFCPLPTQRGQDLLAGLFQCQSGEGQQGMERGHCSLGIGQVNAMDCVFKSLCGA